MPSIRTPFVHALTLTATLALFGSGCLPWQQEATSFIPETDYAPIEHEPTEEVSQAATGGYGATITPAIATIKLVEALPNAPEGYNINEPKEEKFPIPLPNGTASYYPQIAGAYTRSYNDTSQVLHVTISDTRGLPVLTAFLDGVTPTEYDGGFRRMVDLGENGTGWMSYTNGLNDNLGSGSFTMLYRQRFLIQIASSDGFTADEIEAFAQTFHFDSLK